MGINNKLKTVAAAIQSLGFTIVFTASCLSSHQAQALEALSPSYSFHGFGTLGTVYSDEDQADFVSSWLLQPNGAGHTSEWHAGVDTRFGGQVNAQFNEKFSAVLQVVVEHQEDNAWAPALEWANIQYQLTDSFSLRLGRVVAAPFMVSDTRLVGYANLWIRGPKELYQIVPITNADGLDLVYELNFNSWRNTLQLTYGQTNQDIIQSGELRARNSILLSNALEFGFATFHLAYMSLDLDLDTPDANTLFAAYNSLGNTLATIPGQETAAVQASAVSRHYQLDDTPIEIYSAGLRLDPGNWLLMAEWARITEAKALPKTDAWYATLGYRFASLTPYLTIAEVNGDTLREPGMTTVGMPLRLATGTELLNQSLNQLLSQLSVAQKSITAGIRWDFSNSAALKIQYQHIELDSESAGRLGNVQPAFTPGGPVNTFSAAIDFVF